MKILFQGDSITDAGRDKRNYHHLGSGYPKFAAALISERHPKTEFEFINFGIGGNRTCQLFDRLYSDAIAFQPEVISIMIGINDVWHRYSHRIMTRDEQIETNYRAILSDIKKYTNAKIIMISPFLLDCDDKEAIRSDLVSVKEIIRNLADEFADVFIPLDEYFEEALKTQPEAHYYSNDGVHPNENGAKFIAKLYADAVDTLL